ncbi:MAG: type II CAAX endopeptidase family protein [Propionibacteriaceae bacterium]|nr:type II CAAX endopeptidase family protein [Propionibacteriaceae bacterium]
MTNTLTPHGPAAQPAGPDHDNTAPLEPAPGTPYQHLFREPDRRWWRPLASLVLFGAFYLVFMVAFVILAGVLIIAGAPFVPDPEALLSGVAPTGWGSVGVLLGLNLILAGLIPAVLLANRFAHRLPGGYTHSVAGRFRFGWFGIVAAVLVPVWAVYLAIGWAVDPLPFFTSVEPPLVTAALILVCLLTTPLQAAGEEYFFRGWLLQNIGVAIPRPLVALVVPTIVSTILFSLAHGSLNPGIFISLAASSVAACWMTWRTGGLEAAVALHTVNNVAILVGQALLGVPLMTSMVSDASNASVLGAVMSIASSAIAVVLVELLARRRSITPTRG